MRGADWARLVLAAALAAVPARAAPDFTGLWTNNSLTSLTRPEDFKTLVVPEAAAKAYEAKHRGRPPEGDPDDKVGGVESEWWETDVGLLRIRGQARSSQIVSTADGQLPYTAATKAANKARSARRKIDFDNPESRSRSERCVSTEAAGPPMLNGGYNDKLPVRADARPAGDLGGVPLLAAHRAAGARRAPPAAQRALQDGGLHRPLGGPDPRHRDHQLHARRTGPPGHAGTPT
jgi:hypothetical protein